MEGEKWVGLSVNGLVCWEFGVAGVMVCEVILRIGIVGSFSFFVKEVFVVEVWVLGFLVINYYSLFFFLIV